jgi:hypothetical protein
VRNVIRVILHQRFDADTNIRGYFFLRVIAKGQDANSFTCGIVRLMRWPPALLTVSRH